MEFQSLKQKLNETSQAFIECKNENYRLQSQMNESKKTNVELQTNLSKAIEESLSDNNNFETRISELNKEVLRNKQWWDYYQRQYELKCDSISDKKCEKCSNLGEFVKTKRLNDVRKHLMDCQYGSYFLATKLFNEKGVKENYYSQLTLVKCKTDEVLILQAFQKTFSSGSLLLECSPAISLLECAEYVYLDIGKIEKIYDQDGSLRTRPLETFGRLYIKLNASPRRNDQMIHIFSSINSETLKGCTFEVVRNKGRPGELVTCKSFLRLMGTDIPSYEVCTVLDRDLENYDEEYLIDAGNVFGYLDGSAGFSIITRDNYHHDTRWPFLGKVVSGLHFLQDAIDNHDVETIGFHSHGIGFSTRRGN